MDFIDFVESFKRQFKTIIESKNNVQDYLSNWKEHYYNENSVIIKNFIYFQDKNKQEKIEESFKKLDGNVIYISDFLGICLYEIDYNINAFKRESVYHSFVSKKNLNLFQNEVLSFQAGRLGQFITKLKKSNNINNLNPSPFNYGSIYHLDNKFSINEYLCGYNSYLYLPIEFDNQLAFIISFFFPFPNIFDFEIKRLFNPTKHYSIIDKPILYSTFLNILTNYNYLYRLLFYIEKLYRKRSNRNLHYLMGELNRTEEFYSIKSKEWWDNILEYLLKNVSGASLISCWLRTDKSERYFLLTGTMDELLVTNKFIDLFEKSYQNQIYISKTQYRLEMLLEKMRKEKKWGKKIYWEIDDCADINKEIDNKSRISFPELENALSAYQYEKNIIQDLFVPITKGKDIWGIIRFNCINSKKILRNKFKEFIVDSRVQLEKIFRPIFIIENLIVDDIFKKQILEQVENQFYKSIVTFLTTESLKEEIEDSLKRLFEILDSNGEQFYLSETIKNLKDFREKLSGQNEFNKNFLNDLLVVISIWKRDTIFSIDKLTDENKRLSYSDYLLLTKILKLVSYSDCNFPISIDLRKENSFMEFYNCYSMNEKKYNLVNVYKNKNLFKINIKKNNSKLLTLNFIPRESMTIVDFRAVENNLTRFLLKDRSHEFSFIAKENNLSEKSIYFNNVDDTKKIDNYFENWSSLCPEKKMIGNFLTSLKIVQLQGEGISALLNIYSMYKDPQQKKFCPINEDDYQLAKSFCLSQMNFAEQTERVSKEEGWRLASGGIAHTNKNLVIVQGLEAHELQRNFKEKLFSFFLKLSLPVDNNLTLKLREIIIKGKLCYRKDVFENLLKLCKDNNELKKWISENFGENNLIDYIKSINRITYLNEYMYKRFQFLKILQLKQLERKKIQTHTFDIIELIKDGVNFIKFYKEKESTKVNNNKKYIDIDFKGNYINFPKKEVILPLLSGKSQAAIKEMKEIILGAMEEILLNMIRYSTDYENEINIYDDKIEFINTFMPSGDSPHKGGLLTLDFLFNTILKNSIEGIKWGFFYKISKDKLKKNKWITNINYENQSKDLI